MYSSTSVPPVALIATPYIVLGNSCVAMLRYVPPNRVGGAAEMCALRAASLCVAGAIVLDLDAVDVKMRRGARRKDM
jgi:hypothetical protein